MFQNVALLFAASLTYTIFRYVIFGPETPYQIPLFLMNKAVSIVATFAFLFAAWAHWKADHANLVAWGRVAMHAAGLHILLSLCLLSPGYYAKFFAGERMNLVGEISMYFGALTAYAFYLINRYKAKERLCLMLSIFAGAMLLGHLIAMGWGGWMKPWDWHGGLPPISLVTAVGALAALLVFAKIYHTVAATHDA